MKKVLMGIIGSQPHETTLRYCLGLAQRIKAKVEVLQVLRPAAESPVARIGRQLRRGVQRFESTMVSASFAEAGEHETARQLEEMLAKAARDLRDTEGLEAVPPFSVQVKTGDPEVEIPRFVVNDRDIVLAICDGPDADDPASEVHRLVRKLNVTAITTHHKEQQKGKRSPMKAKANKRKVLVRSLIFGALSVSLYTAVFVNQAAILTMFTKGGLYALLPVSAVFLFSYVHGTFASNILSAMGIEPSNKIPAKPDRKVRRPRVDRPQPRATLRA